jgi:hypothetical protein
MLRPFETFIGISLLHNFDTLEFWFWNPFETFIGISLLHNFDTTEF